jgi:D-alanyl-D-alanine carboxypeptidase
MSTSSSRHRFSSAIVATLILLGAASPSTQPASDAAATIDQLLSGTYKTDGPGASVIVVRDGRVLLRRGYGLANLELGVRIAPEMVFRIGSITKQFTAVAILMLLEEGKLALEDEVTKFLPDYPTHGQPITVEHLLTHTSGIPSYTGLPDFVAQQRKDLSAAELVARFKDLPLEFAPGEKYAYNNSAYFLLGLVIEKASGQTYSEFLQSRIFSPLGMKHTRIGNEVAIVSGRVSGYEGGAGNWRNAEFISMTQPFAAGALLSSVDDLALWDAAVSSGKLLKPEALAKAMAPYRLKNGKSTRYGFGWTVTDWDGVHYEEHGGGIPGFATYALRAPKERLFVAVLTNGIGLQPSPGRVAAQVAALALGKRLADPATVTMSTTQLDRYAGVYRVDEKLTRVVARDGDRLMFRRGRGPGTPIYAASPTEFFVKDSFTRLRFEIDGQGAVTRLVVSDRSGPDEASIRTSESLPSESADGRR